MPTTTKNFRYPSVTDTANVPRDIQYLATDVDNYITNNPITINGTAVNLGGSISITGLPSQTGNSGKYLTTNGTSASWAVVSAGIQSITAGTGLTGGGSSGTVTLNLDTTSAYVLPSQSGASGKYLTSNGTSASWATVSSGGGGTGSYGGYSTPNNGGNFTDGAVNTGGGGGGGWYVAQNGSYAGYGGSGVIIIRYAI